MHVFVEGVLTHTKLFGVGIQFVGRLLQCRNLLLDLVDLVEIRLQAGILIAWSKPWSASPRNDRMKTSSLYQLNHQTKLFHRNPAALLHTTDREESHTKTNAQVLGEKIMSVRTLH